MFMDQRGGTTEEQFFQFGHRHGTLLRLNVSKDLNHRFLHVKASGSGEMRRVKPFIAF